MIKGGKGGAVSNETGLVLSCHSVVLVLCRQ